jgi:hypothetical protein
MTTTLHKDYVEVEMSFAEAIHVARNEFSHSDYERRAARLILANEVERMKTVGEQYETRTVRL